MPLIRCKMLVQEKWIADEQISEVLTDKKDIHFLDFAEGDPMDMDLVYSKKWWMNLTRKKDQKPMASASEYIIIYLCLSEPGMLRPVQLSECSLGTANINRSV